MVLSTLEGALGGQRPRARERASKSSLPNGDIRRLRDGATNEVVASSRDHAHLRVSNTMERPATSTRSSDSKNYQGRVREGSPSPNTGFEVIVPGRQGFRAGRELNPACGSANLPWDLPPRSFPFLPVVSPPTACPVHYLSHPQFGAASTIAWLTARIAV